MGYVPELHIDQQAIEVGLTLDHLKIPEALRGNFSLANYEGGHMMYTNPAALEALKKDLAEFLKSR